MAPHLSPTAKNPGRRTSPNGAAIACNPADSNLSLPDPQAKPPGLTDLSAFSSSNPTSSHPFMKPLQTTFAVASLASLATAQNTVTLDGASGSQTYSIERSASGGLTLGLGFDVEYLVVGGGGGGGSRHGGGGGAGGVRSGVVQASNSSYSIQVGAGGAGAPQHSNDQFWLGVSQTGQGSSVFGVEAAGGGAGGAAGALPTSGASGGGSTSSSTVGSGIAGQGFAGGAGVSGSNDGWWAGGGGGGAGTAGNNAYHSGGWAYAGNGGTGLASSISGNSVYYGGGGGGATGNGLAAGTGGQGGGGNGGRAAAGTSGAANTGGGGGAGGHSSVNFAGGNGGSGIVIVRYKGTAAGLGGTITAGAGTASGYTLHTFTSTGSSTLNLSGLNLNNRLGAVQNGVISGAGDLTFTGPGTLTLNAANTFSGVTRINAGTLTIGGNGSIATSSGVSIASGANFNVSTASGGFILGASQNLSGGGTITGDVSIAGSHTPGFSPGIQTFENNLSYTTGASITWELVDDSLAGRGTNYDGIDVAGNLSFTGSTTLNLDFNLAGSQVDWSSTFWNADVSGESGWKIFGVTGSISGFENLTLSGIDWQDSSGLSLASARPDASFFLHQGSDGIYLNYSAVPEPSSVLVASITGALTLLRRRRDRGC